MTKPYQSALRFACKRTVVLPVASPITLDLITSFVHNFAGVVFFDSPDFTNPVQPSAGTTTFDIITSTQPHAFQSPPNDVINADTVDSVNWAGNTLTVRATFAGIVGATHAILYYNGNSS